MLASVAYRSLAKAAAKHADIKVLAAGNEDNQRKAIQMLKEAAPTTGVGYVSTLPQGPDADLHAALLSVGQYDEVHEHTQEQMAVAATMVAADLICSGGFGAPAVYRNMNTFAPSISGQARGFCNGQLMAIAPWFAAIGAANGVFFDSDTQLVIQEGWRVSPDAKEEECQQALYAAANFESALQMVAYRANAFDVQMSGTRRIMCSGFIMRSFFQFFSRMPNFIVPKSPLMDTGVPGSISVMTEDQPAGDSSGASAKRLRKADK